MVVGVLTIEIIIPTSSSLKDKRFVISSMRDKLRNKFNVSVAEGDFQEKWQRAQFGIATIGNNYAFVEESLSKIFDFLDDNPGFEIIKHEYEYL